MRTDRAVPDLVVRERSVADLLGGLVADERSGPAAIVLACADYRLPCSDYRYQEAVHDLIEREGLADARLMSAAGGSAALGGEDGPALIAAMGRSLGDRQPDRIVLVAHQGCRVPGAVVAPHDDPAQMAKLVTERRRRGVELVREAFGVDPEVWFVSKERTLRVHAPHHAATTSVAG